ncbi:MAG: hypothetical protein ACQESR_11460, partial [Planctomycetota bacterium]
MDSGPTQAVLPLVGLVAEKVIRERYKWLRSIPDAGASGYRNRRGFVEGGSEGVAETVPPPCSNAIGSSPLGMPSGSCSSLVATSARRSQGKPL